MSYKEQCLEINPKLKAEKNNNKWQIKYYQSAFGSICTSAAQAWESAYKHLQSIMYKKDDLVVMDNCMEAGCPTKGKRIWRCRTDHFTACSGDIAVFLEDNNGYNYSGYFLTYFLRPASEEEIKAFEGQNPIPPKAEKISLSNPSLL